MLGGLALLLSSCGAGYKPLSIAESLRVPVAAEQLGAATSDIAGATIQALIVPNGPGSWMKEAPWYEVVFAFRNRSDGDIAVTDIKAVNLQGVFVEQVGLFPPQFSATAQREALDQDLASTVPLSLGPFPLGGAFGRAQARADDFRKLNAEYQGREIQFFKLAAKGSLVKSAFFAVSSGEIQEVVFSAKGGGKKGELRVKLTRSAASSAAR